MSERSDWESEKHKFMWKVWSTIQAVCMMVAVFSAITGVIFLLPIGRDDTDAEWPDRSGLRPMTDALTGCQYLAAQNGGMTPRLTADGRHHGCRR